MSRAAGAVPHQRADHLHQIELTALANYGKLPLPLTLRMKGGKYLLLQLAPSLLAGEIGYRPAD